MAPVGSRATIVGGRHAHPALIGSTYAAGIAAIPPPTADVVLAVSIRRLGFLPHAGRVTAKCGGGCVREREEGRGRARGGGGGGRLP